MILLLKPYRIGDYISAQGQSGTVQEIMLFSTKITTADKQTIYIPNSSIATAIINNYSTSETRRVEWVIGISYGDDFATGTGGYPGTAVQRRTVLQDPAPAVYIAALADNFGQSDRSGLDEKRRLLGRFLRNERAVLQNIT